MTLALENDHDLDMALVAIKNYLLSRTDTIAVRKDAKAALNKLSRLNNRIRLERALPSTMYAKPSNSRPQEKEK